MKKKLLLLSFIEGGAVMCAELCGARLLAPVFGSSLYVWSAVMGITLGGLALGYFFGGRYNDGQAQKVVLRRFLLLAALYLMAMPLFARYVLPLLAFLPFNAGVISGAFLLMMPSVFLLGATSPLFIGIQTNDHGAAKVSGTVYAVSTAGGILSTFLCGFLLMPEFGITLTLVIHGLLLWITTILIMRGKWMSGVFTGVAIIFLLLFETDQQGRLFSADGINGRLEVMKLNENGREIKRLLVNGIIQTETHAGTSTLEYVSLIDSLIDSENRGDHALVLGSGGGSVPNLLVRRGYSVTAVEFDPRIINAATRFFGLDARVRVVEDDARRFINRTTHKYSVIVVDVFRAEEQPSHVLTSESLLRVKRLLDSEGLMVVNWHGYTEGELGAGTEVLINTLHKAGFSTSLTYTGSHPDYRNTVISARLSGYGQVVTGPVNTDDKPVLEKANALANKSWRANYLRYYSLAN